MKRSDRVLIIMVAVVVLLAVVAGVLGLISRGQEDLLPEGSPEGTVQRFLLAVKAKNFQEAYGYFSTKLQKDCAYDAFLSQRYMGNIEEMQVALHDVTTFDSQAAVTVDIMQFHTSGPMFGPFDNMSSSFSQSYMLQQEGDQWRFTQVPWPVYWCPPIEPTKVAPST